MEDKRALSSAARTTLSEKQIVELAPKIAYSQEARQGYQQKLIRCRDCARDVGHAVPTFGSMCTNIS